MRVRSALTYLIVLITSTGAFAQLDAPQMECAVVAANGEITLTWSAPDDPGGIFDSYEIFEVVNNVGISAGSVANYNTTNFTVPGSDGNADYSCYYVQALDDGGQLSAPSDTVCSIYLEANDGLVPGLVELDWNYPFVAPVDNFPGDFSILMEYPAGTWTTIATFPAAGGSNNYEYEVDICEVDLNFQIRYTNGGVCNSFSNIDGGTFEDQIDPTAPEITSVTVDSLSNDATLNWNPPPQSDVSGYIIYSCIPGLNPMPLDTIFDGTVTSWTNPDSDANLGSEAYNIASFDSCFTGMNQPDPGAANLSCVNSIYLTHQWEPCTDDVILSWSPYTGWSGGVAFYEVYAAEEPVPGSGTFEPSEVLGIVDGNTTTFLHEDAVLGSSYRYRVRAYASGVGYTAASNNRTATLFYPQAPAYTEMRQVTVAGPNSAAIEVAIDPDVGTPHTYNLERRRVNQDLWTFITGEQTVATNLLTFNDAGLETSFEQYLYRVNVFNGCGDSVTTSNIGTTILLEGLVNEDRLVNTLTWNAYEEWPEGVNRYEIYRSVDDEATPTYLTEVPGSVTVYEDDVSDMLYTEGEFCYYVVAHENPNTQFVEKASLSNVLCLTQSPVIWVPNAFVVNGFNREFKPVISFADFDNYRMLVYSRWGDVIFETEDIEEGWDGSFRGELVPEGLYAFYISVADGAGRIYEERGTVTMLISGID